MPLRRRSPDPATNRRQGWVEKYSAPRRQRAARAWILKRTTRPAPKSCYVRGRAISSGGVVLAGLVAEGAEKRLLLAGRHDVDSVPSADLFAEQASDAGLFVDLHLAEIDRRVLGRRRDAIERANVDAHAASVAVVGMDDGDRALGALEYVGHLAVVVHDRVVGANHPARAAIDAHRGLDVIDLLGQARDGAGRATLLARAASGPILGNNLKRHRLLPHLVDDALAMPMLDQLIVAARLLERDVREKHHEDHHRDDRDVIGNGQNLEKLLKPGNLH